MHDSNSSLIWFRQDLRLADNLALMAAVRYGGPVMPVFIWAPEEEGDWPPGAASRWWLQLSLKKLDASLRRLGSRLIVRRGPTLPTLRDLLDQTGSNAVFWNRRYEPAIIDRDKQVKSALQRDGQIVESFNGSLLFEPWEVQTQQGTPYQVFTPFWKACLAKSDLEPPENAPARLLNPARWPVSLKLGELHLEPEKGWDAGLREGWDPGEAGAIAQLERFLDQALANYPTGRNRPDRLGTSRLSPHLHFGEISTRQIWSALRGPRSGHGITHPAEAVRVYGNELGWREFAHHLLYHYPRTPKEPLRKDFARFPWLHDRENLPRLESRAHGLSHRGRRHA